MRWAGSKKWLVPRLQVEVIGCARYLEPFLGSGSAFLNIEPSIPSIASDENEDLVLTFQLVRDRPELVLEYLKTFKNNQEDYLRVRSMDRETSFSFSEPALRAARLLFLNQTCFNGLYRVNSRGEFNVPYGHRLLNETEFERRLLRVSKLLRVKREMMSAENILRQDFRRTLESASPGDFVYLDPPYFNTKKPGSFIGYTAGGFDSQSHIYILQWMKEASKLGIRALLSNGHASEIVSAAKKLKLSIEIQSVHRSIAASTGSRGKTNEVLIANF
jgi:DNA adenine methylase